jgi:hypothetical protein
MNIAINLQFALCGWFLARSDLKGVESERTNRRKSSLGLASFSTGKDGGR